MNTLFKKYFKDCQNIHTVNVCIYGFLIENKNRLSVCR